MVAPIDSRSVTGWERGSSPPRLELGMEFSETHRQIGGHGDHVPLHEDGGGSVTSVEYTPGCRSPVPLVQSEQKCSWGFGRANIRVSSP